MQCQRPSTMCSAFLQTVVIGSFVRCPLRLPRICAHYSSSPHFNPARLIEPPTMAATETLSTGASPVPNVEDAPPVTAFPLPPPPPSLSLLGDSMQFKKVSGLRAFARAARMFLQIRGRVANGSVLTGRIGGALPEELVFRGLLSLGQPRPLSLETATRSLRLAAHDPRVKHAFFRIETLDCGWARVMELRRHLQYFSQAGKGITMFMEAGGPKEFFLAMGFECFVPPEAQFRLRGFDASGSFVRGVLEKIGAEPHVERIGKYKSAGDQLARRDMSEAQREVLESVVGEISTAWVQSVSEACGKTTEEVREVLDRAPQSMQEYVDAGFLSGIMYESDVEDMLKLRFLKHYDTDKDEEVLKRKLKTVDVQAYTRRNTEKTVGMAGKKRIALIRASGAITSGKNGSNPFIGSTLGSDTLVEIIRKVRDDKRYVACILRCDSPGGSGLASDVMWRELRKLAKKKPLVASMGDVAASGGYYISMACDIVAEKLTITGSVGVVSAKITLQDLYRKIGYRKETISIGKYAELLADERPFTPDEAQYFRTGAELAYKSFVTKAAMCRGKSYEDMQAVAQGRAWTGRQAKEVGLVDHLGGLSRAVQLVKEKCGLKEEEFVRLETVRAPMTFAQRLGLSSVSMEEGIAALDVNAPLALADLPEGLGVQNPLSRLTAAAALPKLLTLIDGAACAGSSAAQAIMEALRKAL